MRKATFVFAVALIGAALVLVPLPLYVVSPGSALRVAERVELEYPEDEPSGGLLLTTVRLGRPSTVGAVLAWLDGDYDVVRREQIVPEGANDDEYFRAQRRLFAESTRLAAAVGLRAAGFDVTVSGAGAQIAAVLPDSPADGELREGDVIIAINNADVEVASDVVAATSRAMSGDVVSLTVRRGDEQQTILIELKEVTDLGRPGLGVALRTLDHRITMPFDVAIEQGGIGGPSAGLMVALTVYELADEGDLTAGRLVAGTGTIDARGQVGPVGGVSQKVAAAIDAGAGLFLAPASETDAARSAAGDALQVIPVNTLDDAIAALQQRT